MVEGGADHSEIERGNMYMERERVEIGSGCKNQGISSDSYVS
jgi:hypothetical protein